MRKEGFDVRIVSYEHIHGIKPEDKKALIDAIDPKPGEQILDAFCGYAAVGKECFEREPQIDLWMNDESGVQLERARENLPYSSQSHFILGHFPDVSFETGSFDTVVIKMGLHEVPKAEQLRVSRRAREILKPKGKLVIWDIMLNKDNQTMFQNVIRKKDELAGFDMLIRERYFFREEEFLETMKQAGFSRVKEFHVVSSRFSSLKRLEQELHNDKSLLKQLNEFIRQVFPESLKKSHGYEDKGDDIQFNIPKKIYVMKR